MKLRLPPVPVFLVCLPVKPGFHSGECSQCSSLVRWPADADPDLPRLCMECWVEGIRAGRPHAVLIADETRAEMAAYARERATYERRSKREDH